MTTWYLAVCQDCTPVLPQPFSNPDERNRWMLAHKIVSYHAASLPKQTLPATETAPRELLTGNPARARKPGRDVVDLARYVDDPEYEAMINAKYKAEISTTALPNRNTER